MRLNCLHCVFHVSTSGSWILRGLATGGSGSSTAPSRWAPWEAFQAPPQEDTGRGLWVKESTLFPCSVLPGIGRAAVGGKCESWKPWRSRIHGAAPGAGHKLMLEWDAEWGGFTARCLPKGEGWGEMQVSGVTALAALVLVCALQTQLQAQLRTCTGSDIEYVTLLRP